MATTSEVSEKSPTENDSLLSSYGPELAPDKRDIEDKLLVHNEESSRALNAPEVDTAAVQHPSVGQIGGEQEEQTYPPDYKSRAQSQIGDDGGQGQKRRICGLFRRVAIIVIILVILFVLGVILGAILRVELNKKSSPSSSSDDTALVTEANTGIASAVSADGSGMFLYYVTQGGDVDEIFYENATLSVLSADTSSEINGTSTSLSISSQLDSALPLAAVSYMYEDTVHKALFFANGDGEIMTMNTTEKHGTWSTPAVISEPGVAMISGSPALCACATSNGDLLERIEIFFAYDTEILEMWAWFNSTEWTSGDGFTTPDPHSGAGCVFTQDDSNVTWIDLYMREELTGKLEHRSNVWQANLSGPISWIYTIETYIDDISSLDMMNGTDLAAVTDGTSNYIFYQSTDGSLKQIVGAPDAASSSYFSLNETIVNLTRISASFYDVDSALFFQSTSDTSLFGMTTDRTGDIVWSDEL